MPNAPSSEGALLLQQIVGYLPRDDALFLHRQERYQKKAPYYHPGYRNVPISASLQASNHARGISKGAEAPFGRLESPGTI